jgi:hypothetical protein
MVHSRWMGVGVASLGLVLGPFAAPALAQANGHNIETVDCEGLGTIQISTQNTHSDLSWGAVQIVDASGHLIPVSFTFTLEDLTTDTVLFSESAAKGSGHASSQQSTATCSETFTSTLAEFWDPAEPLPPGASLDDVVQFTLSAEAIVKQ